VTQVLYGALGGSSLTSDLYTIDPVTGVATSIGPIGHAITALAFDPTDGTLYGVTSNNSAANPRSLITIDPTTGATIAVIGQISAGNSELLSDIDFDAAGNLYGQPTFTPPGATAPRQVCQVDKATAALTPLLSSINQPNHFFAIDRVTGFAYEQGFSFHLSRVDLGAAGATTDLGALSASDSYSAGTFDEAELLWTVYATDGSIRTINIASRVVTNISTTTLLMDGLAWGPAAPPPPPPAPASRFYEGFPWRFIFTKVDVTDPDNPIVVETTTWATDLLSNRQVSMALGASTSIEADVWPDDFRVNGIYDDLLPRIAQTKRMVLAFRREGSYVDPNQPGSNGPWHIKAIGQLLSPSDDEARRAGHALRRVRLAHLPRRSDGDDGRRVAPRSAERLPRDRHRGSGRARDAEEHDRERGRSLHRRRRRVRRDGVLLGDDRDDRRRGDDDLGRPERRRRVGRARTGRQLRHHPDRDLRPDQPAGYTHEVSIYNLAGDDKYEVVMGWDELNHCINEVQRVHDGTPGNFFDKVQAYAGQGGVPVPAADLSSTRRPSRRSGRGGSCSSSRRCSRPTRPPRPSSSSRRRRSSSRSRDAAR
jgi:hypothetical protein